jgi:uncharacterized lipoprotein
MLKIIASPLLVGTLAVSFLLTSGCALSPQIINLQTISPLATSSTQLGRSALVRVRDLREDTERLGSRGGSQPDNAPLLAKPSLQQALQTKMQNSLQQLGFGGSSPFAPLKVDLAIEKFDYQCNEGLWVSQCELSILLKLSIDNDSVETSQPFTLKENRSVVTSPRVEYNEEWINQSIDKLWLHMMSQPQVAEALGL